MARQDKKMSLEVSVRLRYLHQDKKVKILWLSEKISQLFEI